MTTFSEHLMRARRRTKEDRIQTSQRFREILAIVMKHELREGLSPEKVVMLLQDLGPTFVKLGQIASTHPDVLPIEYCNALGQLRTKVAPLPFDQVKEQVERELGKPLEEAFAAFDEHPVGSASIAQVHRAQLPDGTVVAVKVQRPGVAETVSSDLAIMERLVDLHDLVSRGDGKLSLDEFVDEMVRTSRDELDFANEAGNLERFYRNNEPRRGVTSPRYYADWSTSAVLVEDFASAPCAEKIDELGLSDDERDRIAYLTANNYLQQIMEDGFYHADPHAGNVLVCEGGGIEWIDFGMMGTLTTGQRSTMEDLVFALVRGDAYGLKRNMLKIATPRGPVDHVKLLELCEGMADQFVNVDLEGFDTGALLQTMTDTLQQQGFDVDPFVVNLGRGLVTLEGTIALLSPRLNIMQVLVDYLHKSFDLGRVRKKARSMTGKAIESAEAMVGLPSKAAATLDMMQRGQVKVGMELSSDYRFSSDVRAAVGLGVFGFVALGLIVGACILGAADGALRIAGVSVAGALGLAFGAVVAVYILVKLRQYMK